MGIDAPILYIHISEIHEVEVAMTMDTSIIRQANYVHGHPYTVYKQFDKLLLNVTYDAPSVPVIKIMKPATVYVDEWGAGTKESLKSLNQQYHWRLPRVLLQH